MDVQEPAGAIHVSDLQVRALKQAQAADVDRGQARPVHREPNARQDPLHLVPAQNRQELLLPHRPHEIEDLPLPAQRPLVEELDAAQRDGEAGSGEVLDVGEVEEVLAQLVLPELVGRPMKVGRECSSGIVRRVRRKADAGMLVSGLRSKRAL